MAPIIALLVIAAVSMLLIRVGAVALVMTGVSHDTAFFQANSAFFGVGFTTSEAELVVNHPVRRRIILGLIIAGNIGVTSALATVLATVVTKATRDDFSLERLAVQVVTLIGGIVVLTLLWRLGVVQRGIDYSIRWALRRFGVVRALDYELLLHVTSGYEIAEVEIDPGSPLIGTTLGETRLRDLGIVVLGIERPQTSQNEYVGVPKGTDDLRAGDVLTVYGKEADVKHVLIDHTEAIGQTHVPPSDQEARG